MWSYFYNYYLNLIRDNDHGLQLLLNALDQLDLWKNTIVVVTADHGEMAGSHGGLRGKGPFAYELNSHIPLWIVHPDYAGGRTIDDAHQPPRSAAHARRHDRPSRKRSDRRRSKACRGTTSPRCSATLSRRDIHANRAGVLFNYVGLQTIDGNYLIDANKDVFFGKPFPTLFEMHPNLDKRGFLSFVFDGRYKFARYYAPAAFNTPADARSRSSSTTTSSCSICRRIPTSCTTSPSIAEKNKDLILRMNGLLNELMAKEVGDHNNGDFLPTAVRPKQSVDFGKH